MAKNKKLSIDEVKHVAKLANLKLTDEQLKKIGPQLEGILDLVSEMQKLSTDSEEMTSQVTGLVNIFREDEVDKDRLLTQEEALKNAKKTKNGYFVVTKIL